MENKYESRRLRLKKLIDKYAEGKISRFAEIIGRDPSYISRMLYPANKAGRKRIADNMMEHIEKTLSLPRGWFDFPIIDNQSDWPFTSISSEDYKLLSESDKEEVEVLIQLKISRIKDKPTNKKAS